MKDPFYAIDVETANSDMASICQIGLVAFVGGKIEAQHSWLVDPRTHFSASNTAVHGITLDKVRGQPTFDDIFPDMVKLIADEYVVCHTHFDRLAIARACERHGQTMPECRWIDSSLAVRRTWDQFSKSGYNLNTIATHLGIEFVHHDAAEDARAAGLVLLAALEKMSWSLDQCRTELSRPRVRQRDYPAKANIKCDASEGPLEDECFLFTGSLSIPRPEAAKLAADLGAGIAESPTKKITTLVVGDQDLSLLRGSTKSSKHVKVEAMIAAGAPVRIIGETDFLAMIRLL